MASLPPAQCCSIGVKHDGEPVGKEFQIASKWAVYYSAPKGEQHKDVAILYLPDIFGIWQNSKLMADQFATCGYHCLVVDTFKGDAVPMPRPADFNIMKWTTEGSDGKNPHTKKEVDPIVEAAIQFLKREHQVTKIGAVGYCFGGKYVVRHYKSGIDIGFIAHPAGVEEKELAAIKGPLSIAAAETDPIFPAEKRHKSEEILAKCGLPYQMTLYSGVNHGFAVRCDLTDKIQKYGKEQAFYQAVAWFDAHLV
ncbi:hypothetical protein BFJ69_g7830 [Fusarium oxysporum]|uniref:Dienelactone hydrolase domain-containing protein n=1 Tax=Fusarium oxysporum TaxID=5507 RepID=A0A420N4K2_FUSOX|nr:hypothetical protein BFJ69_g7830 [Fusarium oxysporum]